MRKSIRCKISGIVQGVNYRSFTKKQADRLGLVGEVQNMTDGTVRIIAEGGEDGLKEFISKRSE